MQDVVLLLFIGGGGKHDGVNTSRVTRCDGTKHGINPPPQADCCGGKAFNGALKQTGIKGLICFFLEPEQYSNMNSLFLSRSEMGGCVITV